MPWGWDCGAPLLQPERYAAQQRIHRGVSAWRVGVCACVQIYLRGTKRRQRGQGLAAEKAEWRSGPWRKRSRAAGQAAERCRRPACSCRRSLSPRSRADSVGVEACGAMQCNPMQCHAMQCYVIPRPSPFSLPFPAPQARIILVSVLPRSLPIKKWYVMLWPPPQGAPLPGQRHWLHPHGALLGSSPAPAALLGWI